MTDHTGREDVEERRLEDLLRHALRVRRHKCHGEVRNMQTPPPCCVCALWLGRLLWARSRSTPSSSSSAGHRPDNAIFPGLTRSRAMPHPHLTNTPDNLEGGGDIPGLPRARPIRSSSPRVGVLPAHPRPRPPHRIHRCGPTVVVTPSCILTFWRAHAGGEADELFAMLDANTSLFARRVRPSRWRSSSSSEAGTWKHNIHARASRKAERRHTRRT